MDGRRRALIIASDEYDHPGLGRLRAPAADAEALASVLGDKEVGGFHVEVVHNEPAHVVGGRIEDLFAESQSDDLVLLHFSGHGLKNDSGELFLAARNTRPDRLGSTAVPADFVQRCMRASRARSIVLFLDCCYGGAFGEGVTVRAAGSANVLESFATEKLGGGRGRAVITASSAMEYAFEGNSLADEHQQQPSVFTEALVEGLTSGEADRDEDGLVSLNELYDYVYDRVRERNPKQTPGRDVELQGELYLARSRRRRLRPLPIPADVAAALRSDNMFTRLGAVAELRARMASADLGAALGAHEALVEVSRSDIRYVQEAASESLGAAELSPQPAELHFGAVSTTDLPVTRTIHLAGPPLAAAVTVSRTEEWFTASVEPAEVHVSIEAVEAGSLSGTMTITGPTGQVVVPVTADVVPPAPTAADVPAAVAPALAMAPAPPAAPLPAEPAEDAGVAAEPPADLTATEPTEREIAEPHTPGGRGAAGSAARSGQYWTVSGIAALVSGALMLLCIVLPERYDTSTSDADPAKAAYLLYLGLVVLGLGALALRARPRMHGLAAIIGASTIGTFVVLDMLNTGDDIGSDYGRDAVGVSLWVGLISGAALLAAGAFAVAAARRAADLGFAALSRSDWPAWLVLVLAVAGALTVLAPALEVYAATPDWGVQGLWMTVLAVGVPLVAVLARPVLLGRWMLVGWCLAGIAPVIAAWVHWEEQDGTSRGMWFVLLTLVAMAALAPVLHRDRNPDPGT